MKKVISIVLLISILLSTFAGISINANAFSERQTAPDPAIGGYYNNAYDRCWYDYLGYAGSGNCTWYAFSRAQEIFQRTLPLFSGNAKKWYGQNFPSSPTDPRVGDIVCWDSNWTNGYGHVAVVEGINPDGTIRMSESCYGGPWFNYHERIDPYNFRKDYGYVFQGYIHIGCIEHKWDKGKVTTKATCTSNGVKTYTCTVCGETKTEVIKGGHKYKTLGIIKATLLTPGAVGKKCTVCNKTVKTTIYCPKTAASNKLIVTYNGKLQTPGVTVKDTKGNVIPSKYYKLSYKNNIDIGNAKVTIEFKGLYKGAKKAAFMIVPKGTSLKSAKAAGTTSIIVFWNKQTTQTSGYQIQYSPDSKFAKNNKSFTTKTNVAGKTVKGLKAGTTYYFRIRTYKKKAGFPFYSGWSKVISAKTATPPPTWVKPLNYSWSYHGHNLFATSEKYGKYYCYIDREWPYYNLGDSSEYYYLYKYTSATADPQKIYISKSYDDIIDSTLTDGNGNVYYAKYQWGGYGTVYRTTDNGETSEIFTTKNLTRITGIYGGNIYYLKEIFGSEGIEDVHFCKYSIKTKKSSTIKKKAWNLYSNTDTKGRYMLFEWYSQNYSYGTQITLFDAKTGKFYKITTNGRNSHFSGSKIYYLSGMRDKNPKAKVIYCDLNGKNKKTVYQLWHEYEPFCTSSKCMYFYKYLGGGHNNYDFYAYIFKTKKFVKVNTDGKYIIDIQ